MGLDIQVVHSARPTDRRYCLACGKLVQFITGSGQTFAAKGEPWWSEMCLSAPPRLALPLHLSILLTHGLSTLLRRVDLSYPQRLHAVWLAPEESLPLGHQHPAARA